MRVLWLGSNFLKLVYWHIQLTTVSQHGINSLCMDQKIYTDACIYVVIYLLPQGNLEDHIIFLPLLIWQIFLDLLR